VILIVFVCIQLVDKFELGKVINCLYNNENENLSQLSFFRKGGFFSVANKEADFPGKINAIKIKY
jgi:hypothetical protein